MRDYLRAFCAYDVLIIVGNAIPLIVAALTHEPATCPAVHAVAIACGFFCPYLRTKAHKP